MQWREVLEFIKDKKGLVEKEELWGVTTSEVISFLESHGYIDVDYFITITENGIKAIYKSN